MKLQDDILHPGTGRRGGRRSACRAVVEPDVLDVEVSTEVVNGISVTVFAGSAQRGCRTWHRVVAWTRRDIALDREWG